MSTYPRWKGITAVILIVLGCLVATLSVAVIWLNQVVLDTDRYVETVAPLAKNDAIKDAVAARITDELSQRSNADQLAREALPDQIDFLAAPIVGATEGFVDEQVRKLLDTDQFQTIWENANRKAHELVRKVLLGEGTTVTSENGQIAIDLSGVFDIVKTRLHDRGVTIFDNVTIGDTGTTLTLFQSDQLARAQSAVSVFNSLATWLPVAALVLLAAAVWLSRSRMAALFWIGIGIASGMVVLVVGLTAGRNYYLDAINAAKSVDVPAATSFFDIITESFRTTVRRVFAGGLFLAVIGFVLAPYPAAVKLRSSIWGLYESGKEAGKAAGKEAGAHVDLGPAGAWVSRQRTLLRAVGIVVALLFLVTMDQPSISWALLVALILFVYLGALEFLARRAA